MILPSKSTTTHVETNFDDTGRAEAEAFLSEVEGDGAKAGEVFAEVAAKAESANAASGELAKRVKELENAVGDPPALLDLVGTNSWATPTVLLSAPWMKAFNSVSVGKKMTALAHVEFPAGASWKLIVRSGSTEVSVHSGKGGRWEVVRLEPGMNFIVICDEGVRGQLVLMPVG